MNITPKYLEHSNDYTWMLLELAGGQLRQACFSYHSQESLYFPRVLLGHSWVQTRYLYSLANIFNIHELPTPAQNDFLCCEIQSRMLACPPQLGEHTVTSFLWKAPPCRPALQPLTTPGQITWHHELSQIRPAYFTSGN